MAYFPTTKEAGLPPSQGFSMPGGPCASGAAKGSTGVAHPTPPSSQQCVVKGETRSGSPPTPGTFEGYSLKLRSPLLVLEFSGQTPPSAITDFKHEGSQLD